MADAGPPDSARKLAQRLRAEIQEGRWKAGDRLPSERALAREYGLSRATVREGLRLLSAWGHLETRQRVGSVVRAYPPPSPEDAVGPQDILEARLAVEPLCARLAASRAGPAQLAAIQAALEKAAPEQDVESFEQADEAFHESIAAATRSALLMRMQASITQARRRVGWGYVKQNELPMRRRYAHQHADIARAIAAHDAEQAEQAALAHLRTISQNLLGST
jgi:GntR family transcriptional repressor for pyruvate dehydrogenase complex